MNKLKFTYSEVGTDSFSFKYDIELTKAQFNSLKQKCPTEFIDLTKILFIKDRFRDWYYISILKCFTGEHPFSSVEEAEEFMLDDNIFLLYCKSPELADLVEIRRLLIVENVVVTKE